MVSVAAPGGIGRESRLDSLRAAVANLSDSTDHWLVTAALENTAYLANFSPGGYNPKKALIVSQKRKFRERYLKGFVSLGRSFKARNRRFA